MGSRHTHTVDSIKLLSIKVTVTNWPNRSHAGYLYKYAGKPENCGEIMTSSVARDFGLKWFKCVGRLVHCYF